MSTSNIILFCVGVLAFFVIIIYNRLIALRQTWKNALADMEVQLKQRHDLVPNLVETVKGYAEHESVAFEKVTAARAAAMRATTMADKTAAEGALSGALTNLFTVAESYPPLKGNENFRQLQGALGDLENKITAARRFFNKAVAEYNTAIGQFPAAMFAGIFGFGPADMFTFDASGEKSVIPNS